jgi:hypothetical protein
MANIVSDEMTGLKCKRVPHRFDSPELAIADFYWFGVLKQQLQGINASDEEEPKSKILTIFQDILADELWKLFDQSIKRCHRVAGNAENYCPS